MADNSTNNSKKNNRILAIIRVAVYTLAVMTVLFIVAGVLSKYVFKETGTSSVVASEFYFESNYLSEEGEIYNLPLGTKTVSIELKNYPDDLRYASTDINYTVTVNYTPNDQTKAPAISSASGILKGGKQSTEVITLSNLNNGFTYEVTVVGEDGFEKTLKSTFSVPTDTSAIYKWVDDEAEYVDLTVWVEGNTVGEIQINFPNTLIPDNTDLVMRDVKVNGTVVDTESFKERGNTTYGSYTYRFFKTDFSQKYTADDFSVMRYTNANPNKPTEVKNIKKPV